MKKCCCLVLALLPLLAQAYPIDLEKHLNGADVSASSVQIAHDMAAVQVSNHGATAVTCRAVFRNGPEAPRTRHIRLDAGKQGSLTMKFARSVIRVRVALTCEP